ncbi:MAG: chemotaxis response regulator protein-glutamate methylesterase [Thermoclostridium sp.]|nr:chemotaxis response regulator protein-glutamate methylesterase [Thermoclostridium sp.]
MQYIEQRGDEVYPGRKIRILVVDDSILFREILVRGLSSDPGLEVVATAKDPFEARDKLIQYQPDVMTCDIEMPKMNGIEFVRRLLPQYTLPVIMVSSLSGTVFDALKAGAVDFVVKPDVNSLKGVENFVHEMVHKVKIAVAAKVLPQEAELTQITDAPPGGTVNEGIIAIGASTGGTEAIYHVLKCLPANIPGVVIVQHIPPVFSRMFAERMNSSTSLNVKEAKTGDFVENGCVFIAPGDQHMKIKKVGHRYKIECFMGDKVNGHCPSVDVLFESVAKDAGAMALGIILTGMGNDGAKGLFSMRRAGAQTIGQDEGSCVVYGMPKVAYNIGAVIKQAPLHQIPNLIFSWIAYQQTKS